MNRDQKSAVIEEITGQIRESEAVIAVDYRGITVTQIGELRTQLRAADTSFRVTKNTLTERAADQADAEGLKPLLEGPTALAFVRGDVAAAAKAIADFQRTADLLPFKGGILNGETLDPAQVTAISKLPSREVLYQQLVGVVASPISGLARTLNALIGGVAIALQQVNEKKQSGELPAGEAPASASAAAAPADPDAGAEAPDAGPDQDAEAPVPAASAEDPAEGPDTTTSETQE